MSKPVTLKLSLSNSVADKAECIQSLIDYVDTTLTKHEGLPTHFYTDATHNTVTIESDYDGMSLCIERLLQDYASLGLECDVDVDLYSIIVYCSDPELNNLILTERLNISASSQEAMFESTMQELNEISDDMLNISKRVGSIDAILTMRGVYQFKDIIEVIAEALENKNIPVLEAINDCFNDTIH